MVGYGKGYKKWLDKAKARGWKTPQNDAFGPDVWIRYWKACEEYERNPESSRPVVPHR